MKNKFNEMKKQLLTLLKAPKDYKKIKGNNNDNNVIT